MGLEDVLVHSVLVIQGLVQCLYNFTCVRTYIAVCSCSILPVCCIGAVGGGLLQESAGVPEAAL